MLEHAEDILIKYYGGRPQWSGSKLYKIGDLRVEYSGDRVYRVGGARVEYSGDRLYRINGERVEYSGDKVYLKYSRYLTAPRNFMFITATNHVYESEMEL